VKGLAEARYEYITFADDDNWLSADWVQTVAGTFQAHPEVGMISGRGEAVFECPPPRWFSQCERAFVVGAPAEAAGFIRPRMVYGAGMCLRHSAWDALYKMGFEFILSDRRGESLSSNGDVELMVAISFMGWKAWYEPRLQFRHWIPAARLTTDYMRRLSRAIGMGSVQMTFYLSPAERTAQSRFRRLRQSWIWHIQREVRSLVYSAGALAIAGIRGRAVEVVPTMEWSYGRLLGLARTGPKGFRSQQQSVAKLYTACRELKC
jgi:hypothetical protein